jgi:hypothetical protein
VSDCVRVRACACCCACPPPRPPLPSVGAEAWAGDADRLRLQLVLAEQGVRDSDTGLDLSDRLLTGGALASPVRLLAARPAESLLLRAPSPHSCSALLLVEL